MVFYGLVVVFRPPGQVSKESLWGFSPFEWERQGRQKR